MQNIPKKILVVFGTRPEVVKVAPVIQRLQENDRFAPILCTTGQHRAILDQMLRVFNITPDIDLRLMEENQTLAGLTAKAVQAVTEVLHRHRPDLCLVQGDTTTAMVAGLACFYSKIAVGHIEAGLRSHERFNPFPEEINRRMLSVLSSFHFAPTEGSVQNLLAEGIPGEQVFLTGNTVIDALLMAASRDLPFPSGLHLKHERFILVTAHRRENWGQPIRDICTALRRIAQRNTIDIVYPVHPNPNIKEPVYEALAGIETVHLVPPLEYLDFVSLMKASTLLLTDSGGVQEEGPSLGKPVLVMRETTERPEAVAAGCARLVGTSPDNVVAEVERLLGNKEAYDRMATIANPFGDGHAAERIVGILAENL
jgi:UDP-N-acetylglucosamine 2-epimerase (non-hydrolysing)